MISPHAASGRSPFHWSACCVQGHTWPHLNPEDPALQSRLRGSGERSPPAKPPNSPSCCPSSFPQARSPFPHCGPHSHGPGRPWPRAATTQGARLWVHPKLTAGLSWAPTSALGAGFLSFPPALTGSGVAACPVSRGKAFSGCVCERHVGKCSDTSLCEAHREGGPFA